MADGDVLPSLPVLDPVEVLRTLAGTGAMVDVIFGPGSEATGAIVASSEDVSVLQNLDGTAAFVRHDAVQAVRVREANAFRVELGLARPPSAPVDVGGKEVPPTVEDVRRALDQRRFFYDDHALVAADATGRAGLSALVDAVDAALRSIAGDQAANDSMNKDVEAVRIEQGPERSAIIEGTTLVVRSPWPEGPAAVYDPASLREAILDAAR